MNAWHALVGQFGAGGDHCDAVGKAGVRKSGIAFPAIGMNGRARLDSLPDELPQALGGTSLMRPGGYDRWRDRVSRVPGLRWPCSRFPGLACLLPGRPHRSRRSRFRRKPLPLWPHPGPTPLVPPGPGRLVAAQAQHSLQAQGAGSVLLAGDEPHRQHPHPAPACGCPGTPCRRSARVHPRTLGLETHRAPAPTAPQQLRNADTRTQQASANDGCRHGNRLRSGISRPCPGMCGGTQHRVEVVPLSRRHGTNISYGGQRDTHF